MADNASTEAASETSLRREAAAQQLADARERHRSIAVELVQVADDMARTLDRLAVTRDGLAGTCSPSSRELFRRGAQRARDLAAVERHESRRLRDAWHLPLHD